MLDIKRVENYGEDQIIVVKLLFLLLGICFDNRIVKLNENNCFGLCFYLIGFYKLI